MLTEDEVQNQYDEIMNRDISETEKALRLFLFISKNQIFWDGNKITALLTTNKIMFDWDLGLLSILKLYLKNLMCCFPFITIVMKI